MEFLILGPLEVRDRGRRLPLGGKRQRGLLAMLLLNANEVVSSDRLADALWDGREPHDASKALSVAVSRLRKVLEPERAPGEDARILVTRAPGYELRLEPGQLDLDRFEQQVVEARADLSAGDAVTASRGLRAALSLWRGPALADLAHETFSQTEIARLEELRLVALEDRIRADLELGGDAGLVAELETLVSSHPLRERLRGLLMLALYRSGRQAEALEAYGAARQTLVEELGIEPSRELRELQHAMLTQDPSLEPSGGAVVAHELLVGRRRELGLLTSALGRAIAGQGGLVLLAGEPGIGKSRLADELAARARARGARTLWGRCWEAGGAPAYWPWVQLLRSHVLEEEPEALREHLGAGAPDLAQLVPELRELLPDLPAPAADPEGGRVRLFDAMASFLRRSAAARPLILVLDDLHAADAPSLLMLQFVGRALRGSRLLVVGAYRDVDPIAKEPLGATVAELSREPSTEAIRLEGLSESDVGEYLELSASLTAPAGLVEAIHDETEGNPLFLVELVRLLGAEGRLAEAGAERPIPPTVRAVIAQRVGRLSASCRDLLVLAGVLGREFELRALGQLSELGGDELLDALDEAMSQRVVTAVAMSPGRLRFGHVLIRETLYGELTPARRMQLHRRAGEALEAVYASDLEPHLAELAHHFLAAAPAGRADRALGYARRAGDREASLLAYEEAVRHYERAFALAEGDDLRCDLLLALGDATARAGDTPASKRAFRDAAELAGALGSPERLGRAAAGYGGRIIWETSRDDEELVPLLERALASLGDRDDALRVRLLARLAGGPLRDARFPPERKTALSEEALALARRVGDPATLAHGLGAYILGHHSPDRTAELLDVATEMAEVAARAGDKERLLDAHEERFDALFELGDIAAARTALDDMVQVAEELRQPSQDWLVAAYRALFALVEGRLGEAEVLISDARALGERAQSWNAAVSYRLQLYVLRWEQGRLAEMSELVQRSVDEYPTYPLFRAVLAHLAAELGDHAVSRAAFDHLADGGFAPLPFDEEWLVSMTFLAEAARLLADAPRAALVYERLLPYADRMAISYPEISTGPVSRYLGVLAATRGRPEQARLHLQHALEVSERIGAGPALERTRMDLAEIDKMERDGA